MKPPAPRVVLAIVACAFVGPAAASAQVRDTLTLRGHTQELRVYGTRGAAPVIVSSGDGGWIHLGPHVAELLAARGFVVVGFDVKAYLEGFTTGRSTLTVPEEPGDYRAIVEYAARSAAEKPILIGVSEGAGLSLLAATDARVKPEVGGVIGLGLSDANELGWRWTDDVIYVTHGVPHEPTFSTSAIAPRLAPVSLALIHSTHDEYAPLSDAQQILERALNPKRLWVVPAANHRFSDNLAEFDRTLLEAIAWVQRGGRP